MKIQSALLVAILAFITGCSSSSSTPSSNSNQPNEPESMASGVQDTDGDGIIDANDIDDDNDGFLDADDTSPLDSSIPGDFSTPEAILNQPVVQAAINEASAQGFVIQTLTDSEPPDIGGYYREEENTTVFVASDNGDSVGATRSGAEFRYDQLPDNTINSAVVNFADNTPTSYSLSTNALLRGNIERFTRYSRSRVTCTVNDSLYAVLFVGISTAQIDSQTRDIVDRNRISISVSTSGTPTESCNGLFAGGAEVVGGWSASRAPRVFRTQPNQFQHMCVDEDRAFAPTEIWTSRDGRQCRCTIAYQTTCQ